MLLNKYLVAIDMGTNPFHLIIAEIDYEISFKIVVRNY